MQDSLPYRHALGRTSFGERRFNSDLARFSLDLTLARTGPPKGASVYCYPSPPMSGSSPDDLRRPTSPHRDCQPGRSASFRNAPHASVLEHMGLREIPGPSSAPPQQLHSRAPEAQPAGPMAHAAIGSIGRPLLRAGMDEMLSQQQQQTGQFSSPQTTQRSPFAPQSPFVAVKTPRRTKAHVLSACQGCKRAHLACDGRNKINAASYDHQTNICKDSCFDVPHKKRGRPKLNESQANQIPESRYSSQSPSMKSAIASDSPTSAGPYPRQKSGIHRVIKSYSGSLPSPQQHIVYAPLGDANIRPSPLTPQDPTSYYYPQEPEVRGGTAAAFFNLDLTHNRNVDLPIARISPRLRDLLRIDATKLPWSSFIDMVVPTDVSKVEKLIREVHDELYTREPMYLPPIYGNNEIDVIQSADEVSLLDATREYQDRYEELSFQLHDGPSPTFGVHVKLGKTTHFFVALTLSQADARQDRRHQQASPQSMAPWPPLLSGYNQAASSLPGYYLPARAYTNMPSNPHSPYHTPTALSPFVPHRDERSGPRATQYDTGYTGGLGGFYYPGLSSGSPATTTHSVQSSASSLSAMAAVSYLQEPIPSTPGSDHPRDLQLPPIRSAAASAAESGDERLARNEPRHLEEGGQRQSSRKKGGRVGIREILE
ncbi:MAG: hypothetical protein M1829_003173 [Trizodia sp. TS-e1964]|nr:MAG: hypothetical protein M1829_003173 [Trizodia sp. TS-e1964]